MKTIIIPTDYSPAAINAMHYGIEMAKAVNAGILLIHIYNIPVSYSDTPVVLVSVDDLKKNAEEKLTELKKEVEHITSGSIKINTEALFGNLTDELETISNTIRPFAIVMGTRGTTGIEKVLFGSNTLSVIRHLTWPVICVPPGKTFGTGIKKIGFASDFRDVVNATPAQSIKDFVKEFNAELHVLNVDYHNHHFKPETSEESLLLHNLLEDAKPEYLSNTKTLKMASTSLPKRITSTWSFPFQRNINCWMDYLKQVRPNNSSLNHISLSCVCMNKYSRVSLHSVS